MEGIQLIREIIKGKSIAVLAREGMVSHSTILNRVRTTMRKHRKAAYAGRDASEVRQAIDHLSLAKELKANAAGWLRALDDYEARILDKLNLQEKLNFSWKSRTPIEGLLLPPSDSLIEFHTTTGEDSEFGITVRKSANKILVIRIGLEPPYLSEVPLSKIESWRQVHELPTRIGWTLRDIPKLFSTRNRDLI